VHLNRDPGETPGAARMAPDTTTAGRDIVNFTDVRRMRRR
jgi:hypothetical protein